MSEQSCPYQDDVAAWVLGMLPEAEVGDFRARLAESESCKAEVRRLEEATDALALSLPPGPAAPGLRRRLLESVDSETALFRAAENQAVADPPAPRRRARRALIGALAAVALIGLGALLGRGLPSDDPAVATSSVIGMVTPAGGGPEATAAVITRGPVSQLVLTQLGPPPQGRVYQAWVVRDQETVPSGALFSVPRSGDTKVSLPSLSGVRRVIVTAEGPQGSRTPTPPAVVVVVLPA